MGGMKDKRVIIAYPHGFCSGVSRAVEAMGEAVQRYPGPIYGYHEVVHNRQIVGDLSNRGAIFVETLEHVPVGATLLFSAHGVSPRVRTAAQEKKLQVVDATCPFVAKAHAKVQRLARDGFSILLIGHRHHEEVVGVAAEAPGHVIVIENEDEARTVQPPHPDRVGVVTQTTLSVTFVNTMLTLLRERFPCLVAPGKGDICYATQNRQQAVEALARQCECVLVLGSRNSSNSRRLAEIAETCGRPSFLLSQKADLDAVDLSAIGALGVTSGASTPESFLHEILDGLKRRGFARTENMTVAHENIRSFPLPDFP